MECGGVVGVLVEHIHGPSEFGWFVVNHPFRAKWDEMLVVSGEIEEMVLVFGRFVLVRRAVVEALDVKMEASSRSRRGFAIVGPCLLDFGGGFAVILAGRPLGGAHHVADDLIGVELLELGVIESGHGGVIGITVDCVDVAGFLESNVSIAGMRVDEGKTKRIIGTSSHNTFEEIINVAFLYFRAVERNSGMFLGGFSIVFIFLELIMKQSNF